MKKKMQKTGLALVTVLMAAFCLVFNTSCANEILRPKAAAADAKTYTYSAYAQGEGMDSVSLLSLRYSNNGRRLMAASANGKSLSFDYDEDGKAAHVSGASYVLNAHGLPVYGEGLSFSYAYDDDGRLSGIRIVGADRPITVELQYDGSQGELPEAFGHLVLAPTLLELTGHEAAWLLANYRFGQLPKTCFITQGSQGLSLSYKLGADATLYVSVYRQDADKARNLFTGLRSYTLI